MIGIAVQIESHMDRVIEAAQKANFRNLAHAAASIRKTAVASLIPSPMPSEPGSPPHTRLRFSRKGKPIRGHLPRAIVFDADKERAFIGPRFSVVGLSGQAHEFGGEFRGQLYPERSFMGPALEANEGRFADSYLGSIGEE